MTRQNGKRILQSVRPFLTRAIAFAALLAVGTGGWAECAGWQATPEARMACCADGDACPMHHSAATDSLVVVSQAAADSCCAASESDNSPAPASTLTMAVPPAPLAAELFASVLPTAQWRDARRESVPLPGRQVARHLLLSVFLI